MESGMIVMDSVDSDKLKPYLRGESEGDSMNDPSLLQDSNGSADRIGPPAFSALPGDGNPWIGKAVVRGPQSDLLGVLEELEREAEAEAAAGKEALWPPVNPESTSAHRLEAGLDPILGSSGLRPVHSDSQKEADRQASITSPNSGDLRSLSAELPMPPPLPTNNNQPFLGEVSRAREPAGQKAVLAGRTVQGDSSTMPFKPTEPFNLERVAHQHLLDLALNDLSPPASEDGTSRKQASSARGRKTSANNSTSPGPMTIMRNRVLQEKAGSSMPDPDSSRFSLRTAESSSTACLPGNSPSIPPLTPSARLPAQRGSSVSGSDLQPSPPPRSGIPSALVIPRAEQSRDALQKTIYSTMSPTASGILATLNAPDYGMSPRPSPGLGKSKASNAAESTSLLPSPPGRASSIVDMHYRTYNSPGVPGSEMLSTSLSRIPRSPADGVSQSMDLTGLSLALAASKLPGLGKNDNSRPASHRGSKIPLSPAGSATGSARKSKSLTPRGKRDPTPEKQGQAMEAATAELDKLAVMLKQMQEDIKNIPSDAGREASHPLPTSPAPPHARKSFAQRCSLLDAAAQNVNLTPRRDGSTEALPGVDTPDNASLDKVEKMQETSTTVTVSGSRGVRKPLHDAVAEEAEQGFGQASEAFSEPDASEGLSKASVKRSEVSEGLSQASVKRSEASAGLSQASAKRSEVSEGISQASVKRSDCEMDTKSVVKPKHQATGGKAQAKGKTVSNSRSKRLTAEPESKQQGSVREKRHIIGPQKPKANSHGGNQVGGQGPVESEPEKENCAAEVSSACLQPTEDNLVRVAVGKTAAVDAVVVHASPTRTPHSRPTHNDLEQSSPLPLDAEQAPCTKPQPVQHKTAEPPRQVPMDDKRVDAPDPPQPKCACCFM